MGEWDKKWEVLIEAKLSLLAKPLSLSEKISSSAKTFCFGIIFTCSLYKKWEVLIEAKLPLLAKPLLLSAEIFTFNSQL